MTSVKSVQIRSRFEMTGGSGLNVSKFLPHRVWEHLTVFHPKLRGKFIFIHSNRNSCSNRKTASSSPALPLDFLICSIDFSEPGFLIRKMGDFDGGNISKVSDILVGF